MDAAFYRALGRRIAERRNERGLTQEALAEKTEIGASYLARIETGTRRPTLDTLGQIAHALGVPAWHLLADERERLTPDEKAWRREARGLSEAVVGLPVADMRLLTALAERLQARRPRR